MSDYHSDRCGHNYPPKECQHEACGFREAMARSAELEAALKIMQQGSFEGAAILAGRVGQLEAVLGDIIRWCACDFPLLEKMLGVVERASVALEKKT